VISLDFFQVRARTCIGQNNLPRGPSSQGPTDALEAQRNFGQRHPRRGHLKPSGLQVLHECQSPQTQRETGQMHEAQDGQRRRTWVVPQTDRRFKSHFGSCYRRPFRRATPEHALGACQRPQHAAVACWGRTARRGVAVAGWTGGSRGVRMVFHRFARAAALRRWFPKSWGKVVKILDANLRASLSYSDTPTSDIVGLF
jgi:hypothetical protein